MYCNSSGLQDVKFLSQAAMGQAGQMGSRVWNGQAPLEPAPLFQTTGRLAVGKEGHVLPWPVSENPALRWVERNSRCSVRAALASSFWSLKDGVKLRSPPPGLRCWVTST